MPLIQFDATEQQPLVGAFIVRVADATIGTSKNGHTSVKFQLVIVDAEDKAAIHRSIFHTFYLVGGFTEKFCTFVECIVDGRVSRSASAAVDTDILLQQTLAIRTQLEPYKSTKDGSDKVRTAVIEWGTTDQYSDLYQKHYAAK